MERKNSQGKNIKNAKAMMRFLEAVQLPVKVAIMHIKAHQKVSSEFEETIWWTER